MKYNSVLRRNKLLWNDMEETNAYYYVKEANLKWLFTIWLQLYDSLEMDRTMETIKWTAVARNLEEGGGKGEKMEH